MTSVVGVNGGQVTPPGGTSAVPDDPKDRNACGPAPATTPWQQDPGLIAQTGAGRESGTSEPPTARETREPMDTKLEGPNHELFVKVLAQIEQQPERWNQRAYAMQTDCGTAYCFAGWACALTGREADFRPERRCFSPDGEPIQTSVIVDGGLINQEAEFLLGVDCAFPLFDCDNTLDDLYRISADLLGIDEGVLRDKVAAEVQS